MAENESGGTGGGGYSSCGAGLPDSADVGRVPELPVSSAAIIMAQLTALSKQMEAIQQQQTEMKAILQQQTSGNLARSGVSNISVGICKPHTPAEKGAASDKALSIEEYLAKYGVRRFSESSLACEVCRTHGAPRAQQVNAKSDASCGYFLQPLGPSGFSHLRQSVLRHQNAVRHKKAIEAKVRAGALARLRADRAMNVARQSYQIILEHDSYSSYERRVLLLHLSGVDIGNINHSRAFPAAFAEAVFHVIMCQYADFIATPQPDTGMLTPVAIIADKMTPKHITGQMDALLFFLKVALKVWWTRFEYC